MFKKLSLIITFLSLLAVALPAGALLPSGVSSSLSTPGTNQMLTLPTPAVDNSPVIDLGLSIDPSSGDVVRGYAIVHYRTGEARGGGSAKARPASCYGFLASGAKWKNVEPWVVNTDNARGLTSDFVFNNLTTDISKWEDATDGVMGNGTGVNILGNGSVTTTPVVADTSSPDGQNEVYFADVSNQGAIAVTIVWGIFGGPTFQRKLVEWDQIYDDVDFSWSSSAELDKMDFENIATHELGHSVGMADLYNSACADETMYGYATEGETKKQTLNAGDITGVNTLY